MNRQRHPKPETRNSKLEKSIRGFFVTGTDTAVGKTVVTAGLAAALIRRHLRVTVAKPVATAATRRGKILVSADTEFLIRSVAPHKLLAEDVTPVMYEEPLAPSVAAQVSGRPVDLKAIESALARLIRQADLLLVEGIGGLMVPITEEMLVLDLAKQIDFPLIVVARPGLGTLNHTLLTVHAAKSFGLEVRGIVINDYPLKNAADLAMRTNPEVLERLARVPVLGVLPHDDSISVEEGRLGRLVELIEEHVDLDMLCPVVDV